LEDLQFGAGEQNSLSMKQVLDFSLCVTVEVP
jgi:hypothetical protein